MFCTNIAKAIISAQYPFHENGSHTRHRERTQVFETNYEEEHNGKTTNCQTKLQEAAEKIRGFSRCELSCMVLTGDHLIKI